MDVVGQGEKSNTDLVTVLTGGIITGFTGARSEKSFYSRYFYFMSV